MSDFSVRMRNRLSFSRCEKPDVPVRNLGEEVIIVTRRGDLLTISDTGLFDFSEPRHRTFAANLRIYATKTSETDGVITFKMLEKVQDHPDVQHFEVLESNASSCVLETDAQGRRHLAAWGTDNGNVPVLMPGRSTCRGWIFDAVELP